ncbi:hypothetical protein MSPP1_001959 [Malassezia sp. CBS 17886]|nr:hypothetical protein MSPP1_001959 [Malassezia sp. CBS 17886]
MPPRLVGTQPAPMPTRPFTRATLTFFVGFSAASLVGLYTLQTQYRTATETIAAGSAQLQNSADNVTQYLDRISALDDRFAALDSVAMRKDAARDSEDKLRALYSDVFEENLELRSRMWKLGAPPAFPRG